MRDFNTERSISIPESVSFTGIPESSREILWPKSTGAELVKSIAARKPGLRTTAKMNSWLCKGITTAAIAR